MDHYHNYGFDSTNVAGFQSDTSVNYVDGTGGVVGMALYADQLFVTRLDLSQVSVLNTTSLQLMHAFTVPHLSTKPSTAGLVADAIDKLLYIGDYSKDQVHIVNLSMTSNNSVLTWDVPHAPYGVSLTRAGNILVQLGHDIITEYTPNGTVVRSITDSTGVNYAVELEDGIWAVSRCGPEVHGIAMISTNGTVIKSFGSTAGSGLSQMDYPKGIAIDANGYIIVADNGNNRVLVVDPTLTRASQLIVPAGIYQLSRPSVVAIDQSRGRLYVGEDGGQNRVLVFGVN